MLFGRYRSHRSVAAPAAVLALALTLAFATGAAASGPAQNPAAAQFEVSFMRTTIDHHAMAVEMAQSCMRKATLDRLRELCANVAQAQLTEIDSLQTWLQSWYGQTKQPAMTAADEADMADLDRRRGRDFSIAVARMFIQHHAGFLGDARSCVERAEHAPLRAMCAGMFRDQSREIRSFRRLLTEVRRGRPL